jgi:diguanylate cyclase (GGDEF)-like protein
MVNNVYASGTVAAPGVDAQGPAGPCPLMAVTTRPARPTTTTLVSSVRRLSALGEHARAAADIHDGLAEELLGLSGIEEVHVHHLAETGRPEFAVAYTYESTLVRRPYSVPEEAPDSGIEWVASTQRPLVAPYASALPAQLVGRSQMAGAALLPMVIEGRVAAVVVLISRTPDGLREDRLDHAAMLVDIGTLAVGLINARTAARTDSLTGLMNHGAMLSRLQEEIERARRQGSPLACLLVDLDDFKQINDQFGHLAGDGILRRVADTLRREFRRFDRVARYGGDEFVVILPNAEIGRATSAARRILERLREIAVEGEEGGRLPLTVSVGLATWDGPEGPTELLTKADEALSDCKRSGKDSLVAAGPSHGAGPPSD